MKPFLVFLDKSHFQFDKIISQLQSKEIIKGSPCEVQDI